MRGRGLLTRPGGRASLCPPQPAVDAVQCVCRRKDILLPLAQRHDGAHYLRMLGMATVAAVVLIVYALIAAQWLSRTGSPRSAVWAALESVGLVKKKARKLV